MKRFWIICWAVLGFCLTALPVTASTPPAFRVGNDLYIMGLELYATELVPIVHDITDIRRNLRANRCGVVRVNRLEELRLSVGNEVVVNGRLYGSINITNQIIANSQPQCQSDGTLTSDDTGSATRNFLNDRKPLATLADETVHGLDIIDTLAIPGFQPSERVEIHYHRNILAYHRVNGCGYIQDDSDGETIGDALTLKLSTGDQSISMSSLPTLTHPPLCRADGESWVYYPPPHP